MSDNGEWDFLAKIEKERIDANVLFTNARARNLYTIYP
jgi:hypothetical protein